MNKPIFHKTYFRLDAGYKWGGPDPGMPAEKTQAFYAEIRHLFTGAGWTIREHKGYNTIDVIKGKTSLYVHPMDLSGACDDALVPEVKNILSEGKTFTHYKTDVFDRLLDLSRDELIQAYRDKGDEIDALLLNAFTTKRKNLYVRVGNVQWAVAEKITIWTVEEHIGVITGDSPNVMAVEERYNALVADGRLTVTPDGRLARTAVPLRGKPERHARRGAGA